MCNIAGYSGDKQAAPILLEMIRKQQYYDGDVSTGVATIHEGKMHYRKIVGDVDAIMRETDVLDLPGTIGIAHTRPSGNQKDGPLHPFIPADESLALVTNGTAPATKYCVDWDAAADFLDSHSYKFRHQFANPKNLSPKLSRTGIKLQASEVRVHLIHYYISQGLTPVQAMLKADAHMYTDAVMVMIHQDHPESIFCTRTTRPMNLILENGEAYMATTRYGFPEHLTAEPIMLPLHQGCIISRNGLQVTPDRLEKEPVSEMTPYTYAEGYRRIEALLKSEKAPLYFDELEFAIGDMRDLWPGNHTLVQHARLVYDLLWQFDQEGRLQREVRLQEFPDYSRHRWYFSLKN